MPFPATRTEISVLILLLSFDHKKPIYRIFMPLLSIKKTTGLGSHATRSGFSVTISCPLAHFQRQKKINGLGNVTLIFVVLHILTNIQRMFWYFLGSLLRPVWTNPTQNCRSAMPKTLFIHCAMWNVSFSERFSTIHRPSIRATDAPMISDIAKHWQRGSTTALVQPESVGFARVSRRPMGEMGSNCSMNVSKYW